MECSFSELNKTEIETDIFPKIDNRKRKFDYVILNAMGNVHAAHTHIRIIIITMEFNPFEMPKKDRQATFTIV